MRRLVVRKKDLYAILEQEVSQHALVLFLTLPVGKPGSKLAEDDERQNDLLGFREKDHCFDNASTKIDVSIRIESDPHFQRSSSI